MAENAYLYFHKYSKNQAPKKMKGFLKKLKASCKNPLALQRYTVTPGCLCGEGSIILLNYYYY